MYTGEALRTKLATWNVLTAETARLLLLLSGTSDRVSAAVRRAEAWLGVSCFGLRDCAIGECAHSLAAYLRLLARSSANPAVVVRGINTIRAHRDGNGRWRRFPFYYTLLTLTEIQSEPARRELRYAVEACERVRGRCARNKVFAARREALVERILVLDDLRLL